MSRPELKGQKFYEGWVEHKDSQKNDWNKYWLVLKRFEKPILFIFENERTSPEYQVGLITLDSNMDFQVREGDSKNGYKFDIYTTNRRNKFKSRMFHERELWRAYIVGLVKGTLPNDLDLAEAQIQMIQSDIDYHKVGHRVSSVSIADSGIVSGSIGSGGSKTIDGGPTMTHRFYWDPRQNGTPSWFVSGCSREVAEKILINARNFGMGNTLMRESTTHMSTGSYVITKRVDHASGWDFDHYEVTRVAEGYKLNVENNHNPMKCLSDVIHYFIQTAGPTTKLLTSNNLQSLGLDTPDYQRIIPINSQPSKESSLPSGLFEPPADYEEPGPNPYPSHSRTFSAATYNQESRNYQKSNVGRPVVGLDNLNRMIEGFETPSNAYYNEPDMFVRAKEQQKERDRVMNNISSPPPPSPCNLNDRSFKIPDVPYQPAPPTPRQMNQTVPPPPPPISSLEKLTQRPTSSATSESIQKISLPPTSPLQEELKLVFSKRSAVSADPSPISPKIQDQPQQPNQHQVQSQGQSEKEPVESGVVTKLTHSFQSLRKKFDTPKPSITDQTFRPEKVGRASISEDSGYDDTAIIKNVSAMSSGSSIQISHNKDPRRRASEPVIPGQSVKTDYVNMRTEIETVDPTFLSRLNQMMSTPLREKLHSKPHQSFSGEGNEGECYEQIPADEIFYANEKYNN